VSLTTSTSPATSPDMESEDLTNPRVVAREAAKIARAYGWDFSPRDLRVLAARFIGTRRPASDLEPYMLAYADPTGEAAVRNVLRERGF